MLYESVTEWQAGDFIVRVQAGLFRTRDEAVAFGSQPMRLVRNNDRLVLLCASTGRELDEAYDENITVFRVKPGARAVLRPCTMDDYEPVSVSIAHFGRYPELASFGSLSFGVHQATELTLSVPSTSQRR